MEEPDAFGPGILWLATYGYAIQIYFDFAGYSNIAIGSARVFGYKVPENFNYPYLRSNIALFWRNWYMFFTSWITDYIYIPLGGNRRGPGRAAWNRFASMTIWGLWHGAAFHFVVWGMYHGVGLNIYRGWVALRTRYLGRPSPSSYPLAEAAAILLTFHFVCIGWVLFILDVRQAAPVILRLLFLG